MSHIASNWALAPDDFNKYTSIFVTQDLQKNGTLSGEQARELLSQSGLPPHVLFQVWNLADSQQTGFLDPPRFAIAMHLIYQKLAGHNLPLQLPLELQPQKLQQLQSSSFSTSINLQSTSSSKTENSDIALEKNIVALETELNKKRLLTSKNTNQPPIILSEIAKLQDKIKEQHAKIQFFSEKNNFSLDSQWTPDLPRLSKLESELPLLSNIEDLTLESKSILNEILSSGRELFALEDAQSHGYKLPTEGAKLPTIPLPTGGDSVIAQKAAAMLAQRMQALQLSSTTGPIPADAQRRLDAHQSVLESQKNSAISLIINLNKSVCLNYQSFQAQSSKYKLGHLQEEIELKQEFDKWSNYKSNSSISTANFIDFLSFDNVSKIQPSFSNQDTEFRSNSGSPGFPPSNKLSMPSNLPSKPPVRQKPPFPVKKPPPPQRSAPIPKITSEIVPTSLISGVLPSEPKPSSNSSFGSSTDPPTDDFTAIAQASRLARAKAQQLERSQSLSANNQPKNKPIPKRPPPPTPPPKITPEELSRQHDQQHGPSVGEIRSAARRARLLAQSNMNISEDTPKSEILEEAISISGHVKKSSVSQLAASFSSESKEHVINSSPTLKKAAPPLVKNKPIHLQSTLRMKKPSETPSSDMQFSLDKSKFNQIASEDEIIKSQPEPKLDLKHAKDYLPRDSQLNPSVSLHVQAKEFTSVQEAEKIHTDVISVNEPHKEVPSFESPQSETHSSDLCSPIEITVNGEPEDTASVNTTSDYSIQSKSQTIFENVPSAENPWSVKALYDYETEDGISFLAGSIILVTDLPSDASGWCLGHVNNLTGWIPNSYLDLPDSHATTSGDILDIVPDSSSFNGNHLSVPEETIHDTGITDSDITIPNETTNWATLADNFTAEIEGGEYIEFEVGQVQIIDTSNPDWHLAKHPDSGSLAYLPVDILSYSSTSNPFARKRNKEDQSYSCYSDTDVSELHSTQSMRKAQSAHHLPLSDYQEASSPHRLGWANQVDPTVLEGMSKSEVQRLEAIHELVTTEKTYLRDMQLVVDVFYLPLESQAKREELVLIFANLPELVVVNTLFLSELEAVGTESVGSAFLSHVSDFQAYGPYCGNQAAASRYLQTNHPYVQFLKKATSRPECRMLSLASFLLQPVQRITRYPLLLKQIIKYTPQSHPEYPIIQEAIRKAESTLEQINREAYVNENAQQLREMETRINLSAYPNFRLSDLTKHLGPRQAIIDGPLAKHKSNRALHGFLFNDMFLLAQTKSSGTYQFELYRPPMTLNRLTVRDAQTSQGRRGIFSPFDDTCFQIILAKEILTLKATTASTKKKWLSEFNKAIKTAMSNGSSH